MTTDKMRILVVEDKKENIEAAKAMLKEHDLVVVSGFDQALACLTEPFNSRGAEAAMELALIDSDWKCTWVNSDGKSGTFESPQGDRVKFEEVPEEIQKLLEKTCLPFFPRGYDVVLTDVMYPKGGFQCMGGKGIELVKKQGEMPYGPIVALLALQQGVKRVGILTSGDHHSDPFVFAFDSLRTIVIGDTKIVSSNRMDTCVETATWEKCERPSYNDHAAYDKFERRCDAGEIDYVKDWAKLLEKVLSDDETVEDY